MAKVYVSIGSNIDRDANIRGGVADLQKWFGELALSRVYESEAVGFDGDNFFNLVAAFDTDEDVLTVAKILREIENDHGRTREGPRFSSRTLDIDLLLFDDLVMQQGKLELPREEITKNAFVLWPLAEIAPQLKHPVLHKNYAELWAAFDKNKQPLWPVEFEFC
ncbi:MAG: 2-amino-4-hydroxy-6-hydroxymethyldihydropteridine diphosphokinase [Gammaproteobacteria bacterium]|nr:2-amino-4-hydroxy-6-hydroxymethyldihydropteridine diphosphokinase [Gammaproteobacteria bacterium]MCW8958659.1 2-amino-4-hydroxy-6-hydroxymethyldihydropteridine diphosphokinase [Gammaproteobacteria bacterium]MCW8971851.1 2-amino-4-hydroxy-6-hydroxymethyldihydropteridine diphosphokinase [Gammaproteobacteria bacterium]MCW8994146.1 2-amino-4-hydroxy-6-hydroxymethyldihydropteridine diphosphokinase [Gammaproteobacteria bacterium]